MTTDKMRDLHVDHAICNAATPGPWAADKGYEQSERGNYVYSQADGSVVCAEQDGTDCVLTDADARFIAEARIGWPHAIERAIKAEELLRAHAPEGRNYTNYEYVTMRDRAVKAEAEVERLRAVLRTIARIPSTDPAAYKRIALNALKEEEATPMTKRECPVCGELFTPSDNEQIACNKWCGENLPEDDRG